MECTLCVPVYAYVRDEAFNLWFKVIVGTLSCGLNRPGLSHSKMGPVFVEAESGHPHVKQRKKALKTLHNHLVSRPKSIVTEPCYSNSHLPT